MIEKLIITYKDFKYKMTAFLISKEISVEIGVETESTSLFLFDKNGMSNPFNR